MTKFEANYSTVNEELARRAKASYSFSEYIKGSTTEEYKDYINSIVDYANKLLEKHPTDDAEKLEKVQDLINRYSDKLAKAIDKKNEIDCRCPSVMITGAGNFPVAKKEKQIKAIEKHWEETKNLYETDYSNYYYDRIRIILTDAGGIRSDDKNAVEKIKAKIARLEQEEDLFGNKKAEIRRLKERLLVLAPDEMKQGVEITINDLPATYENIIKIFNSFEIRKSEWYDKTNYYLDIPLVFYNGKRRYKEYLSNEVNEDGTLLGTYGNSENGFKTIWKPLDDITKFNLVISRINGSGNKAVMYQILKDLDPRKQAKENEEKTEDKETSINGEQVKIVENDELMRLQILFDDIPEAETRTILKSNGFKWSPKNKAWQRLLNDNAKRALERIKD